MADQTEDTSGDTMWSKMLAAKKRMIPKQGFNLVGIDTYEMPGEEPYLIAHYDDEQTANAALEAFKQANPDEPAYVYGAEAQSEKPVQKSVLQKFNDFTAPIVQGDTETYERVKRVLMSQHGYKKADFEKDGDLYGWSTNELLDLILKELRSE